MILSIGGGGEGVASLMAQTVKNLPLAGNSGSIPRLGRSSGERNGNPL